MLMIKCNGKGCDKVTNVRSESITPGDWSSGLVHLVNSSGKSLSKRVHFCPNCSVGMKFTSQSKSWADDLQEVIIGIAQEAAEEVIQERG
jgi:hypothetical protein